MLDATDKPGKYCQNRLCEWTLAVALFATGLELFIFPSLMTPDGIWYYLFNIFTPAHFTTFLLIVGFSRMIALLSNGGLPMLGPMVRSSGAIMASGIWLEMAFALMRQAADPAMVKVVPVTIPLFLTLALSELVSTYRAAADANVRWS